MTASHGSVSTQVGGTTSVTATMPTGIAVGDMLVAQVSYWNGTGTPIPEFSGSATGWTFLGSFHGGDTRSFALDQGPRGVAVWYKVATSTSETAPQFTQTSVTGLGMGVQVLRATKTLAEWAAPVFVGSEDSTSDTTWSVTPATDPGASAGDLIYFTCTWIQDTYTLTSPALDWPGATDTNPVSVLATANGQGYDARVTTLRSDITGGASTGVPTFSAAATNGTMGVCGWVRLRDQAAGGTDATVAATVVSGTTTIAGSTAGAGTGISPTVVASVATIPGATAHIAVTAAPSVVAGVASVASPAITIDVGATVPAATVATAASITGPVSSASATLTPTTVATSASVGSSVQSISVATAPATVAGTVAIGPTISSANTVAAPTVVARVVSIGTPSTGISVTASPTVISGSTTIASPGLATGATTTPSAILSTASIPAPTATVVEGPTPAVVAGQASVGSPALTIGTVATPTTISTVASVAAPNVSVVISVPAVYGEVTSIGVTTDTSSTVSTGIPFTVDNPGKISVDATIAPSAISSTADIGGTATSASEGVAVPLTVPAKASISGNVASVSAQLALAAISIGVAIGSIVDTGVHAKPTPATIAATVNIPQAQVATLFGGAVGVIAPPPVSVPTPTHTMGAGASPGTVTGVTFVHSNPVVLLAVDPRALINDTPPNGAVFAGNTATYAVIVDSTAPGAVIQATENGASIEGAVSNSAVVEDTTVRSALIQPSQ